MNRHTKTTNMHAGFAKYIEREREIKYQAHLHQNFTYGFTHKSLKTVQFCENYGPFELYSFKEATELYRHASLSYNTDKQKDAQMYLKDLIKHGNRKQAAIAPHQADIDGLYARFPNFAEAIDRIAAAAALSRIGNSKHFVMKPLLLLGSAGIGKTAFCQSVANIIQTPYKRIDIAQMSSNAILSGLSLNWSTGQPGELLRFMGSSPVINPMILLDEVDKATGNHQHPIEPTLLTLLETESARSFKDEALLLRFNCEYLLTFATANDIDSMSQPLVSRFDVVDVRKPNHEETEVIIKQMYQDFLQKSTWGGYFNKVLDERVIAAMLDCSPRKIKAILQTAFGNAAKRNSTAIELVDIKLFELEKGGRRYGFL